MAAYIHRFRAKNWPKLSSFRLLALPLALTTVNFIQFLPLEQWVIRQRLGQHVTAFLRLRPWKLARSSCPAADKSLRLQKLPTACVPPAAARYLTEHNASRSLHSDRSNDQI